MKFKYVLYLIIAGLSTNNDAASRTNNLLLHNQSHTLGAANNLRFKFNMNRRAMHDKERKLELGNGFDSRTGMVTALNSDACMASSSLPDNQKYIFSNPQGDISWTRIYTAADIGNMLGVSIEGGADFGIFSASVAGKYTRETIDTRHTLHFNYAQSASMDAKYNITGLGSQILSTAAKGLLEAGMNDFTQICGDSVVRTAKVGAMLLVDVAVEFQNHDLKAKFEGEAKGSIVGIGYIAGSATDFSKTNNTMSTIKVSVHQFGGDVSKLSEIFGKPDMNGNYNITGCDTRDGASMSKCTKFINDVMNYGNSTFKDSITFKDLKKLYTYDYTISKYSQMGISVSLPLLTDEQKTAREYLKDTITQDRMTLQYLKDFQKQSFYNVEVDIVTKDYINKAISDYKNMISEYNNYQIIDSCYGDTANINTHCVYAYNEVKKMREKYKSSINIARTLSYTIPINLPIIGNRKLVSINVGNYCDLTTNECGGFYIAYSSKTSSFNHFACLLDTWSDNRYFKKFPSTDNLIGKSVYCYDGLYVKRTRQYNTFGIAGRMVNNQPVDYPVNAEGYNSAFFYSGIDLMFNPI